MSDTFTIEFPAEVSDAELDSIRDEIRKIGQVEDADSMAALSIDAQSIMLWVQVASGVMGVLGAGVPLLTSIVGMIRGKGLKNVTVKLPDGTSFTADNASTQDIEKLLKASKAS